MSKHSVLAALAVLSSLAAGCATTGAQAPESRLVGGASSMVVEVEGQGTVDVSGTQCQGRCQIDWDKVAEPVLVADAAPGWRFDHWDASATDPMSDPSKPRVYRAVFRSTGTQIAKR